MKRREFLGALSSVPIWPIAVRAQQPAMPVIGILHSGAAGPLADQLAGFRRGLSEVDYAEGKNVAIEYRWAEGHYDRLPALAADLVGRKVSVLATGGGVPSALAAKAATKTIPIVFLMGADPIKAGAVASLNRPEGNVTGVSFLENTMAAKRVALLSQIAPKTSTIGMLVNPRNPDAAIESKDTQTAVQALGRTLVVVQASTDNDFEPAFAALAAQNAGAFTMGGDPFFTSRRDKIIALCARYKLPAVYPHRTFTGAGGLMSYGTSFIEAYRQWGIYIGRVLKGVRPADLPVIQPTKFEFIINIKTAKALDLDVPPSLLAITDEVIE
jgi:ABC-type uncharacterized transport system substrate-binding protein